MTGCKQCGKIHNVGFISTRFAGTDGVTLETNKWAEVFADEGFKAYYLAGELEHRKEISYLVEEAHFKHPEIKRIYEKCFSVNTRSRHITKKIHELKEKLKTDIEKFVKKFKIDLLVPENALTIPLNIPLSLALTEFISENRFPTIAHHHDFFWERQQFLINGIWEYLNMAFPPHLPSIEHVVLNSSQDNQLSLRTGISSTVIPNVMDFENPPAAPDDYSSDVRQALGIEDDELFILQPTRVVKRKGIEHAIELVNRMKLKAKLVISHASGDEGHSYEQRIRKYSKMLKVDTLFVSDIISEQRGRTASGKKIYTLFDIYPHADLITYPSNIEGFGNAFLEAVYFSKPILVNTYSIYETDIKPKGFKSIEISGYVTDQAVRKTQNILKDSTKRKEMVEHNYKLATKHFSFAILRRRLSNLIAKSLDCSS